MGGRHLAPDRRRLYRETLRLAIMLIVLAVVLIGGAVWISGWLESGETQPVTATQDTITTTSVLAATLATRAPTTSTTSTVVTTTSIATTTAPSTSSTTTTTLPSVRSPSEITVIVLNSTDTKGMAARLTTRLSGLGYTTLEADNFTPFLEITRVWFVEGFGREAAVMAEQIPDAIVELFPNENAQSDITVVLGASFSE